jgi:hypothetical protein
MAQNMIFAQQNAPGTSSEGNPVGARGTRDGIAFTATWKQALLLEGRLHQITVGTIAAGGDVTLIVGGGNGTTVDQDQPEFGISVPSGTSLIPVQIDIACQALEDANDEVANIIVYADTAAAYADDGTVTSETPVNLLDASGVTTVATAFSAATADITDPTVSRILAMESIAVTGAEAAGFAPVPIVMHYEPEAPHILTGPCAIYGHWGGTGAVSGVASVIWAEVPTARYTI